MSTRRRSLRVLGFLAAGVVFTVLVAWACAAFSPLRKDLDATTDYAVDVYARYARDGWPPYQGRVRYLEGFGFYGGGGFGMDDGELARAAQPNLESARIYLSAYEVTAGWPLRCLRGADVGTYGRGKEHIDLFIVSGIGDRVLPNRWIPYRPLPFPFAVNVLAYACAFWLVFDGVPAARRRLVAALRCCPHCGAELGDRRAASCPGCGRTRVNRS